VAPDSESAVSALAPSTANGRQRNEETGDKQDNPGKRIRSPLTIPESFEAQTSYSGNSVIYIFGFRYNGIVPDIGVYTKKHDFSCNKT